MKSAVDTYRYDSKSQYEYRGKSQKFTFKVHPINQYSGANPYFSKPAEIGHFSLGGDPKNRTYHDNASQLHYYIPPVSRHFAFNLREGYDTYIGKDDDVKERLTYMLMWISKHSDMFRLNGQKINGNDVRLNTDFIAWRGNFTKLLITPYETREPWKMATTLFNGTIFISEMETEQAREERLNRKPLLKEMCYWGHKFEGYMTEPSPEEAPNSHQSSSVVNDNEEYRSIVHTQLDGHSILMGAEIDCCIKSHSGKPPDNYIELKTTRLMNSFKQKENFMRYKMLKFWAQSFLSGVPKIIVGLRDDDGIVTSLREYQTLSIPHLSEDQHAVKWDASLCINFFSNLLTWLKKVVLLDNPNIVYMMTFDEPFDYINIEVIDDGSERFLPSWFTDVCVKNM